jgi:hypothetical protein
MITCYLRYVIDPYKLADFEQYCRLVIRAIEAHGGRHHGHFLPHEGPNNIAVTLFSFQSLAAYESYRLAVKNDEHAKAAWRLADDSRCIVSFERSFMRPLLSAGDLAGRTPEDMSSRD